MGLPLNEKPNWRNYIKLPDRNHEMGTGNQITFLGKDPYNEELRYNEEYHKDNMFSEKPYFRLFFRQLKTTDKDQYLGYSYRPEKQHTKKIV